MIDAQAYAAAERLFKTARATLRELPALFAEYDSHVMLHGAMTDAVGRTAITDGQDALVDHVERHAELLERMQTEVGRMTDAVNDARAVIAGMDDDGDRLVLRLYYLVGLSERQIPNHRVDGEKVWHYSPDYVPEKKSIALVHAAPVVRDLGLVAKYAD